MIIKREVVSLVLSAFPNDFIRMQDCLHTDNAIR